MTMSLADGLALQVLGELPASDPVSLLGFTSQIWMCKRALEWAKEQECKRYGGT